MLLVGFIVFLTLLALRVVQKMRNSIFETFSKDILILNNCVNREVSPKKKTDEFRKLE